MKSYNGFRRGSVCMFVHAQTRGFIWSLWVEDFEDASSFTRWWMRNENRKRSRIRVVLRVVSSSALSSRISFHSCELSCFVSVFYFEKEGIWSLSWGINKLKRNIRLVVRTRFYRWEDRSVVVSWKILKMNLETEIYIKQFRKTVFGRLDAMVK